MKLPQILDFAAATPLRQELANLRGEPLELDGSSVERLGGLCLQVLLSAQATWAADGQAFRIVGPSTAFVDAVRLMAAARYLIPQESTS